MSAMVWRTIELEDGVFVAGSARETMINPSSNGQELEELPAGESQKLLWNYTVSSGRNQYVLLWFSLCLIDSFAFGSCVA